jgi:hypothetical protein
MSTHPKTCSCCALPSGGFNRRHFLKLTGSAGLVAAFPFAVLAAEGNYEAMVLSCIDPRFPEPTLDYMKSRGRTGRRHSGTISALRFSSIRYRRSSPSIIAIVEPPRSLMARSRSTIRRSKPKRIAPRSPSSASKSTNVNPSSRLRSASWRSMAEWRFSANPVFPVVPARSGRPWRLLNVEAAQTPPISIAPNPRAMSVALVWSFRPEPGQRSIGWVVTRRTVRVACVPRFAYTRPNSKAVLSTRA